MTAVQITQPLLKSPACKQSQNPHMDSRRPAAAAEGRAAEWGRESQETPGALLLLGRRGLLPSSPLQLWPMQNGPFLWKFFHLSVISLPSSLPPSLSATPSPRDTEQGLTG